MSVVMRQEFQVPNYPGNTTMFTQHDNNFEELLCSDFN